MTGAADATAETGTFHVTYHGSVAEIEAMTDEARRVMHAMYPEGDEVLYWCGRLMVEPRYLSEVDAVLSAALEYGLCPDCVAPLDEEGECQACL